MRLGVISIRERFLLFPVVISAAVAVLIHFPELVSLFDVFESHTLFPGMDLLDVLSEVFFTFISLLILFGVTMWFFHLNNLSTRISGLKIIGSFFLIWILSSLLGKSFVFFHHTLGLPAIDAMVHHYLHPLRDFIITSMVIGSCYMLYLIRRQQQVVIENQQLRAENILNQYEALKNQLNPHMLFNSLNTLRSLVRENQERAQEYIQQLSNVLRYTLRSNEAQSVTLEEEMEFMSAYLFLLKMRFEDNLHFEINISHLLDMHHLPPMSLQMLVENAVKHNEISTRRPFTVNIYTEDKEIVVRNVIQPKLTATLGTGIGLVNLAKRYRLLFHREIVITENKYFTVRIPLINDSENESTDYRR